MSVYLIEAVGSGRVKIGSANDPSVRIRAVATSCPFPIAVLAVREGNEKLERAMHRAAADHRLHLEWFAKWRGVEAWFARFEIPANVENGLARWLTANEKNNAQFGEMIGRTAEAVRRYAAGDRIPDRDTMPLIVEATGGQVTANDFFGIDTEPQANAA